MPTPKEPKHFSEKQCLTLFKKLFPKGLAPKDVMQELAPKGWEASPLRFCFHPTVEDQYQRALSTQQIFKSMYESLKGAKKRSLGVYLRNNPVDEDKIARDYTAPLYEPYEELQRIVGMCSWDIFSSSNQVIKNEKIYHLGSYRGSGAFIDLFVNPDGLGRRYTDYYLGSAYLNQHIDLSPVYELIFSRLQLHGCYWIYNRELVGVEDVLRAGELHTRYFKKLVEQEHTTTPIEGLPAIIKAYFTLYGYLPYGY